MKAAPAKLQLVMLPTEPTRESIVDEYYKLDAQVKAFAPVKSRHEKLRSVILAWFPDLPGDQATSVSGIEGKILISPRQMERTPASMSKVCKLATREKFFAACSVTIKWLEATFGKEQAEALLVEKQTGSRKLVAIPNLPQEQAKAA